MWFAEGDLKPVDIPELINLRKLTDRVLKWSKHRRKP